MADHAEVSLSDVCNVLLGALVLDLSIFGHVWFFCDLGSVELIFPRSFLAEMST
jgi:hypothetical protein